MSTRFHEYGAAVCLLQLGTPYALLDAGSHDPILCELEEASGEASSWIVKSPSMYPHGATSLLREFVGSDLAALSGLLTPRVGSLQMPSGNVPTDESPAGVRAREMFAKDAGRFAFCSEKIEAPALDPRVLERKGRRPADLVRDAITLFAFDATFWHYDRTPRNPNVLLLGRRLVAIDHDRICHGIEQVDESGASADYASLVYQPDDSDRSAELRDHVVADFIRPYADHSAWESFIASVSRITPERVSELLGRWPDELDQGRNGLPAGLKADLKRFLLLRIQQVRRIVEEARRVVA